MSYKSALQEHNTKLQQAIDKANALPDAGSGSGKLETCTLRITNNGNDRVVIEDLLFMTLNEDGSLKPNIMNSPYGYHGDNTCTVEENSVIVRGVVVGQPVILYADANLHDESLVYMMTNAKTIDGFASAVDFDESHAYKFFVCTVPGWETIVEIGIVAD